MHVADEIPRHRRADRTVEDVRLPANLRWPLLAFVVVVFLFGGGTPVWHDPFDIDRAIWLSYAPIPVLVAAGLWWSKRLSATTLFLNTLEIVLCKFALTYTIAMVAWATFVRPASGEPTRDHAPIASAPAIAAPAVTPWPAERRGNIVGTAKLANGAPAANVFVFVSAGLEDIVFERQSEPHTIAMGPDGFPAALMVARRWEPLVGRSTDGRLHTLLIDGTDGSSRAVPLLPSGEPASIPAHALTGVVPIRCNAHRQRAHLVVLHHAFHARTDQDGRFAIYGVPAVDEIELTAWTANDTVQLPARVDAGAVTELVFSLP